MLENCKILWGAETYFSYDIFTETDDYELYHCFVRKEYMFVNGNCLFGSSLFWGEERALDDMERKLGLMAQCKTMKEAEAAAKKAKSSGGLKD